MEKEFLLTERVPDASDASDKGSRRRRKRRGRRQIDFVLAHNVADDADEKKKETRRCFLKKLRKKRLKVSSGYYSQVP